MGNNPSKPAGSGPPSAAAGTHNHLSKTHSRREPTRRDSIQASSSTSRATTANSLDSSINATSTSQTSPQTSSLHKPISHQHSPSAESSPSQRSSREDKMGSAHSAQSQQQVREKIEVRRREREHEQSHPVRVPGGSDSRRQRGPDSQFESSGPPRDPNYIPHSNLNFPPRLPLPIEEEVHTPGSPIISPADLSSALDEDDVNGALPRRTSILSSTTVDDEDNDYDQGYVLDGTKGRTVPTVVEWKQGGDRVYVTGTFASWSRKYRMHRDPHSNNVLSTVIDLPPGTHHVKFIVDGEMQLSNELPTAVDYTNILVNYIEVSADDIPKDSVSEEKVPEGIHPPLLIPSGIEAQDHDPNAVGKPQSPEEQAAIEPLYYGDSVPQYLLDLDREERSSRFQRAEGNISEIPTPPSLPLFLGKSILNGNTPMKDDSSVLNMPNHTVLNHLATSSIKNDVLATSLTTRYKRKYVTTIMYRPTTADVE